MNLKRACYYFLTTMLGIILSYGIHAIVELLYLDWATRTDHQIVWTMHFGVGACALPAVLQYGLLLAGAAAGLFIGRVWWRIVYVEHRHWMR